MTQYRRSAWQAVAVAAFVATAALAITLTRPQQVALTETTSACRAAALRAWVGIAADSADLTSTGPADTGVVPRVSSTGTARTDVYYTIEFTNVSGHVCSLYGYPGVSAYDAGHLIGSPAMLDTSIRPSTVMLAPGDTAHAVLHFIFAAIFREASCEEVMAPALSIYPPDAGRAMLIPVPMLACSRKGADYLSVQPVQPRAGIPGFPHY